MKLLFSLIDGGRGLDDATHGIATIAGADAAKLKDLVARVVAFRAALAADGLVSVHGRVRVMSDLGWFSAFAANYDAPESERILGLLGDEDFVEISDADARIIETEGAPTSIESFHVLVYEKDVVFSAVRRQGDARYLTASIPFALIERQAASTPAP